MTNPANVIYDLTQVTPEWLTAVLRQSGALTAGKVAAVAASGGGGNWSSNARLALTYSEAAQGPCPSHLFLKMVNTDTGDGEFFLPSEVTYYTRDYVDLPEAPLVHCYHGVYDPEQNRYHLLLHDVSATHEPAYALRPTLGHGQALAEALAILHAHHWGEAKLRQIGASFHDKAHFRRFISIGKQGLPHVLAHFGSRLQPQWPELMQRIFTQLPKKLITKAQDKTHFTRLHGDPNPGNILAPREGERPLYLIDQQPFDWSITTWSGLYDLAYIMTLFWQRDLRRALEIQVLRYYHQALINRGVAGYEWEQLFEDYRLCVAVMVPLAVEYMRDGGDRDWNEFRFDLVRRALLACEDLHCDQLL